MEYQEAQNYLAQAQEELNEYKQSPFYQDPATRDENYIATLNTAIDKLSRFIHMKGSIAQAQQSVAEAQEAYDTANRQEQRASLDPFQRGMTGAFETAEKVAVAPLSAASNIALGATGTIARGLGADNVGSVLQGANRAVQGALATPETFEGYEGPVGFAGRLGQGLAEFALPAEGVGMLSNKLLGKTAERLGKLGYTMGPKVSKAVRLAGDTLGFGAMSLPSESDKIEAQRGEFSLGRSAISSGSDALLMSFALMLGSGKGLTNDKEMLDYGMKFIKGEAGKHLTKEIFDRAWKGGLANGVLSGGVGTFIKETLALPNNPTEADKERVWEAIKENFAHAVVTGAGLSAHGAVKEYLTAKDYYNKLGSNRGERLSKISQLTFDNSMREIAKDHPNMWTEAQTPENILKIQQELIQRIPSDLDAKDRTPMEDLVKDVGTMLHANANASTVLNAKTVDGRQAPERKAEPVNRIIEGIKANKEAVADLDKRIAEEKDLPAQQRLVREKEALIDNIAKLRSDIERPYTFDDIIETALAKIADDSGDGGEATKVALAEMQRQYAGKRFNAKEAETLLRTIEDIDFEANEIKQKEQHSRLVNALDNVTKSKVLKDQGTVAKSDTLLGSNSKDISALRKQMGLQNIERSKAVKQQELADKVKSDFAGLRDFMENDYPAEKQKIADKKEGAGRLANALDNLGAKKNNEAFQQEQAEKSKAIKATTPEDWRIPSSNAVIHNTESSNLEDFTEPVSKGQIQNMVNKVRSDYNRKQAEAHRARHVSETQKKQELRGKIATLIRDVKMIKETTGAGEVVDDSKIVDEIKNILANTPEAEFNNAILETIQSDKNIPPAKKGEIVHRIGKVVNKLGKGRKIYTPAVKDETSSKAVKSAEVTNAEYDAREAERSERVRQEANNALNAAGVRSLNTKAEVEKAIAALEKLQDSYIQQRDHAEELFNKAVVHINNAGKYSEALSKFLKAHNLKNTSEMEDYISELNMNSKDILEKYIDKLYGRAESMGQKFEPMVEKTVEKPAEPQTAKTEPTAKTTVKLTGKYMNDRSEYFHVCSEFAKGNIDKETFHSDLNAIKDSFNKLMENKKLSGASKAQLKEYLKEIDKYLNGDGPDKPDGTNGSKAVKPSSTKGEAKKSPAVKSSGAKNEQTNKISALLNHFGGGKDYDKELSFQLTQNKNHGYTDIEYEGYDSKEKQYYFKVTGGNGGENHVFYYETEGKKLTKYMGIKDAESVVYAPEVESAPKANPIKGAVMGNDTAMETTTMNIKGRYAIIDVDDAKTFGDIDYKYQNRLRDGNAASDMQINKISKNLKPYKIVNALPTAGDGPMVLDHEGNTLAGNGRITAIRQTYENYKETAEAYRQFLIDHASDYGLKAEDIEKIKKPILVRVINEGELKNDKDFEAFVSESNENEKLSLNAAEKAREDARRIKDILGLFKAVTKIESGENQQFVDRFIQVTHANLGEMLHKGALSREGKTRIENALMSVILNKNPRLVGDIANAINPEMDVIRSSLQDVAGKSAKVESERAKGNIWDIDINGIVSDSLQAYFDAVDIKNSDKKYNGVPITTVIADNLSTLKLSEPKAKVITLLANLKSRSRVTSFLEHLDNALVDRGHPKQITLDTQFDKDGKPILKAPTEAEIVDEAIARFDAEYKTKYSGLDVSSLVRASNSGNLFFRKVKNKGVTLPYSKEKISASLKQNSRLIKSGDIKAVVVDRVTDIPGFESLELAPNEIPQDISYEKDGITYIVRENIPDGMALETVSRHAIGAHLGAPRILGEKLYEKMCEHLANSKDKEVNRLADLILAEDSSVRGDRSKLGKELFARVFEKGIEEPASLKGKIKQLWQDIKFFFKRGMRKLGYNGAISEDELQAAMRYVYKKSLEGSRLFTQGIERMTGKEAEAINKAPIDGKPLYSSKNTGKDLIHDNRFSDKVLKVSLLYNERQSMEDIKNGKKPWGAGFEGGIYGRNGLAGTLVTGSHSSTSPYVITKDRKGYRELTPKEMGRLMGYSETDLDRIEGKLNPRQTQFVMGNSIAVPVAKSVMGDAFKAVGIQKKPTVVSLFSGVGAFESGLEEMGGYRLARFSEINPDSIKAYTLMHNQPESKNVGDISRAKPESFPKNADLFTFGFPCQDLSPNGSQKGYWLEDGSYSRSGLFFTTADIIEKRQPKIAIAENSSNLMNPKYFTPFKERMEKAGYNVYAKVLNAAEFGVPQNRERTFAVCIRKDLDNGTFKFSEGNSKTERVSLNTILESDKGKTIKPLDQKAIEAIHGKNPLYKKVSPSEQVAQKTVAETYGKEKDERKFDGIKKKVLRTNLHDFEEKNPGIFRTQKRPGYTTAALRSTYFTGYDIGKQKVENIIKNVRVFSKLKELVGDYAKANLPEELQGKVMKKLLDLKTREGVMAIIPEVNALNDKYIREKAHTAFIRNMRELKANKISTADTLLKLDVLRDHFTQEELDGLIKTDDFTKADMIKIRNVARVANQIFAAMSDNTDLSKEDYRVMGEGARKTAEQLTSIIEGMNIGDSAKIPTETLVNVNNMLHQIKVKSDLAKQQLVQDAKNKAHTYQKQIRSEMKPVDEKAANSKETKSIGIFNTYIKPGSSLSVMDNDNVARQMGPTMRKLLSENIRVGQSTMEHHLAKGNRVIDKIYEDFGGDKGLKTKFLTKKTVEGGHAYDIDVNEAMNVSAMWNDRETRAIILKKGGVDFELGGKADSETIHFTVEELRDLDNNLSELQKKAIADGKKLLFEYLQPLNEVRERLEGVPFRTILDGTYAPRIHVGEGTDTSMVGVLDAMSSPFIQTAKDANWIPEKKMRNKYAFPKFRLNGWTNSLETYKNHASLYIGMAEPLRELNRVYDRDMKKDIIKRYGKEFADRIDLIMRQEAGQAKKTPSDKGVVTKYLSNLAASKLTLLSAMKQFTSVPLASSVIDKKYLVKAIGSGTSKENIEDMMSLDSMNIRYRDGITGVHETGAKNLEERHLFSKITESKPVKALLSLSLEADKRALGLIFKAAKLQAEGEGKGRERAVELFQKAVDRTQNTTDLANANGFQLYGRESSKWAFLNMYLNQTQKIPNEIARLYKDMQDAKKTGDNEQIEASRGKLIDFAIAVGFMEAAQIGLGAGFGAVLGRKNDDTVQDIGVTAVSDLVGNPILKPAIGAYSLKNVFNGKRPTTSNTFGNDIADLVPNAFYDVAQLKKALEDKDIRKGFETVLSSKAVEGSANSFGMPTWPGRYLMQFLKNRYPSKPKKQPKQTKKKKDRSFLNKKFWHLLSDK